MKTNKSLLHIYANNKNVGDLLSAIAIQNYIDVKMDLLLWENTKREGSESIFKYLSKQGCIVIGGGGLLMDYFSPLWELIINNHDNKKIIVWGVGECRNKDHESTLPDYLFKSISEVASLISVRDYSTQARFINQGNTPIVTGCPSTMIAASWPQLARKEFLLHVVHSDLLRNYRAEWRSSCQQIADYVGLKYVEINHILPKRKSLRFISKLMIKYLYQHAGFIVTSRLHGLIIGSTRHVPVIPVSNDHKIESYWSGVLGGKTILAPGEYDSLQFIISQENYDSPDLIFQRSCQVITNNNKYADSVNKLIKQ